MRALSAVTLAPGVLGLMARDGGDDGLPFGFGVSAMGCLDLAPEVFRNLLALAARSATLRLIRLDSFTILLVISL